MFRRFLPLLVLTSGCASSLTLLKGDASDWPGSATPGPGPAPSRFERCGTGGFIAGSAIDSVVIAGDLTYGEKVDGVDGLLIVPLVLDLLLASILTADCLAR